MYVWALKKSLLVCMRDKALSVFFLSQTSSALIFCTVSHLHVRESRADLPYGTVGARQDLASNTYMTHFEAGIFAAQQKKKKKKPKQHEKKKTRFKHRAADARMHATMCSRKQLSAPRQRHDG